MSQEKFEAKYNNERQSRAVQVIDGMDRMQDLFHASYAKVEEMDVEDDLQQDFRASAKNLRGPVLSCRQEYLNELPEWQDRSGF